MSTPLLNHRYRIVKSLAEGGFGKTFLVEDTQMPSRRQCVIKQLKPMNDRPEVFRIVKDRFSREAAVLEAVGKGNSQIPDLYAYFEEAGQFYLVQEWIEGEPLVNLAQTAWPEDRVRELLANALRALAHVHRQNIIHRDIKPENIILRKADNLPCLIDFGAVKELMSTVVRQSGATQSSLVIGTPGFMPPEQAAGRPTFSSDLYSLSMTMIYLLTGRSPAELPTNSQNGEVLWQQFVPELSPQLATVLSRAVHPYTQQRYATADAMLAALLPDTVEQPVNVSTLEQPITSATSGVPTVATSNSHPAALPIPAATTAQQSNAAASAAKSPLPWKQIGVAASALVLAGGILVGVNSQGLFEKTPSVPTVTDFPAAVKDLEAALEADPADIGTQVSLAEAYYQVGDYDGAIAQAENILETDATNVDALIAQGLVQTDTGQYAAAIATFTTAAEQGSREAEAMIYRGNVHYEVGEYDKAVDDYRSALRMDPGNGRAYKEWAGVSVTRGNIQEALQNLDLAIENGEETISAYVNRGSRKSELGDRVGAAADWDTASRMTAYTASEFASRGYAQSRLGNKTGALADYNQALIINPNHIRALENRAALEYESGEKETALRTLDRVLAINPNSVVALILRGEIKAYSNPADQEGAIAAYTRALEVNPNDPGVLNNRCSAYAATGQVDLALTDCDRGLQINPRSEALYLGRGNIRLSQDNPEGAIQDFSRSLEITQETTGSTIRANSAYSNRASARIQLGDLNGALSDVNAALELKPDDAPDLYKRGLIKMLLEDGDGARADMQRAADIYVQEGRTESHREVVAMLERLEQLGL